MKAIIETGGKQYYVAEGDIIYVEKLDAEAGKKVVFDKVLMANGVSGNPYVKGATVEGEVVKQGKGKKLTIFTYVPNKKSTRKKQGHRQPYTTIEIKKIKYGAFMIKIKVEKDMITLTGHANYADYGKDTVCAAVSAIVITSVEAISSFDESAINIKEETDKLTITITKHDNITNTLISNMIKCLKEVANQYPKNIKIIDREE